MNPHFLKNHNPLEPKHFMKWSKIWNTRLSTSEFLGRVSTVEFLISVAPQLNIPLEIWAETISIPPSNKSTPLLKKDDFHAIWYIKSNFSNFQKAFYQS